MNITFSYPVQFQNGVEVEIEFTCSFIKSGFDYDGYGGGHQSEMEIDNIDFCQIGLNVEEITYINDKIIDSDALFDRVWDEFNNQIA